MANNYEGGMSLGELIEMLEDAARFHGDDWIMAIGLGEPHSNRGYYETLAFVAERDVKVTESLARAKSAVGKTYHGWKGGEFTMDVDTEVYLTVAQSRSGSPITESCLEMLLTLSEKP